MAVQTGQPAPYAPPQAVLSVVNRYRERGLPTPITLDVLMRAGVSESLAPRTLQALRVLDLIQEDGTPTATFEGLRRAPSAEFPARMQEFVRGAYPEVFSFVDPSTDTIDQIRDAFRPYEPFGQQARMLTLFMGLVEAAGMRPAEAANNGGETTQRRPARRVSRPPATRPRRSTNGGDQAGDGPPPPPRADPPPPPPNTQSDVPPAVAGLLATLPRSGATWNQAQQERFLAAFKAVIELLYPVDESG
jgi:hypothetical protein